MDPKSTYRSLGDAPNPEKDGEHMWVILSDGWLAHYISQDGEWIFHSNIHPSAMY